MKINFLQKTALITAVFLCFPLLGCSQARYLTEMPAGEGISKIFISKTMIKLGTAIGGEFAGEYASLFRDINSIEVYSCDNETLTQQVESRFHDLIAKTNLDELLIAEDDGESAYIYAIPAKDPGKGDETVSGLIIYNVGKKDVNIVVIQGEIDMAEIAKLAQQ